MHKCIYTLCKNKSIERLIKLFSETLFRSVLVCAYFLIFPTFTHLGIYFRSKKIIAILVLSFWISKCILLLARIKIAKEWFEAHEKTAKLKLLIYHESLKSLIFASLLSNLPVSSSKNIQFHSFLNHPNGFTIPPNSNKTLGNAEYILNVTSIQSKLGELPFDKMQILMHSKKCFNHHFHCIIHHSEGKLIFSIYLNRESFHDNQ